MSAGRKALQQYEAQARKRLGKHMGAIRSETGRLASATAQRHPYGLVAATGATGLVLGSLASPRPDSRRGAARRKAGMVMRAGSMWVFRKLAFD